ncbi:MAG: L-asparaginase [Clostridiales bacterium]|jgi:L-asparaginase|nr:L-asparaginase [Clostridiales bacterium]
MKKRIAVVFTGGTISMKVDERIAAAIPALSSEEILSMVTNVDKIADIEVINFGQFPGPHMTPERILELSRQVKEALKRPDIHGVVITHGTDSLEETAYFLDLNIHAHKPIVFVAAMRNSSELGYDGPSNLSAAICTAASDHSRDKGVLIVMNNEVNSARETTKSHTLSLDTFKSLEFGPLGIVDNDEVIFYRQIIEHEHIETDKIEPAIELVKACVGSNSSYLDFVVANGCKGIVLEAMGRGNVPPEMIPGIRNAISRQIPVVIVSRCPMGRVLDSYGYPGGGRNLRQLGAIFGGNLNGQKARIKLMLSLGKTQNVQEIKEYFEDGVYA